MNSTRQQAASRLREVLDDLYITRSPTLNDNYWAAEVRVNLEDLIASKASADELDRAYVLIHSIMRRLIGADARMASYINDQRIRKLIWLLDTQGRDKLDQLIGML